ncbi:YbaN family protein [Aliikangiella sp. IMCC44359]|uniref:YbaN family protein n=1 Tax=Aliikangiella sp. IMCC44359 TaxID=3459125 RepID=UPI00403B10CB
MINKQSGAVKYLLILLGIFFVMLGFVGIFLPGLPTTIFLIAAAACFAKSSPCLHAWLLSHRWFGPIIYHWNSTRSIPRKAKILALSMMALACIYTGVIIDSLMLKLFIYVVMLFPAIFVFRLPLTENVAKNHLVSPSANSKSS